MIKHVHIIGNRGNMAQRYIAGFNYIGGVKVTGHDKDRDLSYPTIRELCEQADGFLICTPTANHLLDIEEFLQFNKPILCEKPIVKDAAILERFLERHKDKKHLLTMMNQYEFIYYKEGFYDQKGDKLTSYDYFKSGGDGLFWDCINIVGLAKEEVVLNNTSPIWMCKLNGRSVSINSMDNAYLIVLSKWRDGELKPNMDYALEAHRKVQCLMSSL